MPTAKSTKNSKSTPSADAAIGAGSSTLLPALPAPEELAKYEKIIPGGAERILELAEQQASQHNALEARRLETSVRTTRIRQAMIFVLALSAALLGGALLLQGSELAGLMIVLIDALSVAAVTIYGRKSA